MTRARSPEHLSLLLCALRGAQSLHFCFFEPIIRVAFFRRRYADLWLRARVRGIYEPLAILFMSLWLSYSTWDAAQQHLTEAAVLGSILAASFLVALFLASMGLIFGGAWREMPDGISWPVLQKLEMVRDVFAHRHTIECAWKDEWRRSRLAIRV